VDQRRRSSGLSVAYAFLSSWPHVHIWRQRLRRPSLVAIEDSVDQDLIYRFACELRIVA
jgi:hypothetical protein